MDPDSLGLSTFEAWKAEEEVFAALPSDAWRVDLWNVLVKEAALPERLVV